jgi:hypothetical protein
MSSDAPPSISSSPRNTPSPRPPDASASTSRLDFPIARLVVLFSLAVGTALDAALGPFLGAGTGEPALFRAIRAALEGGDVLLADRGFASLWEVAATRARGADIACRMHQSRASDFRRGRGGGRGDHVVTWARPPRPDWMDEACHAAMPASLTVREARLSVGRPGFRTRVPVVTTTLLGPGEYPRAELAALDRARWSAELDLRALKATRPMGVQRVKTPDMVRKEVWAHLLGYNLVRGVMAEAAADAGVPPSDVSFAGALQSVNAFSAVLWSADAAGRLVLTGRLRAAVARHRVGGRPARCEPREKKQRPKPYPWLKEPRAARRLRWGARGCA